MVNVIAVEHEKLHLLQSSQGTVVDPADVVEPTEAQQKTVT